MVGPTGVGNAGLGKRFGALILDTILFFLTLVIEYIIWWLIVLARAQTEGKQIVGIWVIGKDGSVAAWGRMFLREIVIKELLLGFLLSAITSGIEGLVDYLWALWDRDTQTLHDKVAGTVVVQGPRPE